MTKKIVSLILALAMVLPLFPAFDVPAFAEEAPSAPAESTENTPAPADEATAEAEEEAKPTLEAEPIPPTHELATSGTTGDCTWTLDGTVLTISGNGAMGSYDLKNKAPWGTAITKVVIGNGVTSIGNYAFYNCTSLTSVTIGSGVTSIGTSAFFLCISLKSVTIGNNVTSIGYHAFRSCTGLTSISIGSGVTSIAPEAFYYCIALTTITIPDSVTSIGDYAFKNCDSLTTITIPDGVTSIGEQAFSNTAYYNAGKNWKEDVLYIGKHLIAAKTSISGSYTIEDGTKTIAAYAFLSCTGLTSVTIPDSVTSIGNYAFSLCSHLESVTIGNGVTSIGLRTFYYCTRLESVTIGNGVTSIGEQAFTFCTCLTSVWYTGTVADRQNISISSNNTYLTDATWHYVDGDCDTICNECGATREPLADHIYDNDNDFICNVCGFSSVSQKLKTTVSTSEIAQGESFTVTVTLGEAVNTQGFGLDFTKAYDHDAFEWVSGDWSENVRSKSKLAQTIPGSYAAFVGENTFDVSGEIYSFVLNPVEALDCSKAYEIKASPSNLLKAQIEGTAISASHTYDNACDINCNVCGAERSTAPHDYSVQDKNAETHWLKCSVCGAIDESTRESHGFDNACDTDCNVCGQIRAITHDYSVWDQDDSVHWLKCSVCSTIDETSREAHGFDNACDTDCNVCGQVRTITHDYSVRDKDETHHWLKCSVCGAIDESTREAHGFDNACDTDCNVCGQVRVITHDYSVRDKDETHHWMKCSVCGAIDESTREAHGFDNACDTDCNVCGQIRAITHDYSVRDKDETHHWMKCSVCGAIDESTREAHGFDNACDTTCNECGQVRQVPDHVYDNDRDAFCNECGHERPLYTPGDVDDNGTIDMDDAIYLLFAVNFPSDYPLNQPTDFDGSGEVDMDDAIYLLFHVNFSEDYPLH